MPRIVEDLLRGAVLYDLARVHDRDTVRHIGDDAEVVGDEDDGELALRLQLVDQLQDLGLDRHVQSRRGFVADQDVRVRGQGDRDDDTLAHAAGELEGILVEALARLGDADLIHQLDGTVAGDALGHAGGDAGGVRLQVVDGGNGLRAVIAGLALGQQLLVVRGKALQKMDEVALDQLQIGDGRVRDLPVWLLAPGDDAVILCLLPRVDALGLRILADGGEIAVDLALDAGTEGIAPAVLDDRKRVDGGLHQLRELLLDGVALRLVQILPLKDGDILAQGGDGLLHVGVGEVRGIADALLGIGDEAGHEMLVKVFQQVRIELLHRHVRQRLVRELQIIAHAEEVWLRQRDGRLQERLDVLQVRDQAGGVAALLHAGDLFLCLGAERAQLLAPVLDHIFVYALGGKIGDVADSVLQVLRGVLLELKDEDPDILFRLHRRFVGLVIVSLELDVLELKAVEILAFLGKIGFFTGVFRTEGTIGALLQIFQVGVERNAAFLLAGLALQDHGLRQLLADLDDRVQAGHGVLEDHGDLVAADLVEILLGDLQKILAVIDDLAGFGDRVARLDTQDGLAGHGLAGAGLADDGEGLALRKVEIDAAHGLDLAVGGAE